MSWDIYGNPLQRGHCEVHPHVHEEYPCSVCLMEREQRRRNDANNNAQHDMILEVEHLKMQRDELLKILKLASTQLDDYAGLLDHHGYSEVCELSDLIGRIKQVIGGAA